MATVTTPVTGYNIKSSPPVGEKVTSFMTSCDDEGRTTGRTLYALHESKEVSPKTLTVAQKNLLNMYSSLQ